MAGVIGKIALAAIVEDSVSTPFVTPWGAWRPSEDRSLLEHLQTAEYQSQSQVEERSGRSALLQSGLTSASSFVQSTLPGLEGEHLGSKLYNLLGSTKSQMGRLLVSELASYSSSRALNILSAAFSKDSDPLLVDCARLSKWVYKKNEEARRSLFEEHDYEVLDVHQTPAEGLVLVLARKNRKLFLIFKGSKTLEDWIHNLAAGIHKSTNGCNFHSGILDRSLRLFAYLRPRLAAAVSSTTSPIDQVVITGHSLGAGCAFIVAGLLRQLSRTDLPDVRVEHRPIHVRLFAPPAVSNCAFGHVLNAGDSLISVVYQDDLVPALSLGSLLRCSGVDVGEMPKEFFLCPPGGADGQLLHVCSTSPENQYTYTSRPALHFPNSISIRQLVCQTPLQDHKMKYYLAAFVAPQPGPELELELVPEQQVPTVETDSVNEITLESVEECSSGHTKLE